MNASNSTPYLDGQASSSTKAKGTSSSTSKQISHSGVRILCLLFAHGVLAVASHSFNLLLHPLYGSIPTSTFKAQLLFLAAIIASIFASFPSSNGLSVDELNIAGLILCAVPSGTWVLLRYGKSLGPVWGPGVVQLVGFAPVALLVLRRCSRLIFGAVLEAGSVSERPPFWIVALSQMINVGLLHLSTSQWESLAWSLPVVPKCNLIVGSGFAYLVLGVFSDLSDKPVNSSPTHIQNRRTNLRSLALSFLFAISFSYLATYNPQCRAFSLSPPHVHPSTQDSSTHILLSSQESITGHITVGEQLHSGNGEWLRYLRCDHSILGGLWVGVARKGMGLGGGGRWLGSGKEREVLGRSESVYGTFLLQEAVRLVERREEEENGNERGLIIGLGVGISANALHRHGVNVTTVEIDPVVYQSARDWFGLEQPRGGAYLEDARKYLAREGKKVSEERASYDYVIHDVFTGGSVPPSLFTTECWSDIKQVLSPNGVVAINFAGEKNSLASQAVLKTVLASFAYCRAFEDAASDDKEAFKNMVIFCSANTPVTFRAAKSSDFLTPFRKQVLSSFHRYEISLADLTNAFEAGKRSLILNDGRKNAKSFESWQRDSAFGHWHIMNQVLPWSTWLQL